MHGAANTCRKLVVILRLQIVPHPQLVDSFVLQKLNDMKSIKQTLLTNGISSGAAGLLLTCFPGMITELFSAPSTIPFVATGIFFMIFAFYVVLSAFQSNITTAVVKRITSIDVLWVVTSIFILLLWSSQLNMLGNLAVIVVALWVAMMALLQFSWIKKSNAARSRQASGVALSLFFVLCSVFANAQQNTTKVKSQKPVDIARDFLEAVKEKSHLKAAPLMDSLIEWHQPGTNKFAGIKRSAAEVFKMFGGFLTDTEKTLTLHDVTEIAVNGNQVACLLTWKASKPNGDKLEVHNIDVYTIKDGKIIKAVIFTSDIEQENRFWGK